MPLDFTLDTYRLLLDVLDDYKVYTVRNYLEKKPSEVFLILRHDVDRAPKNALHMARMEAERSIFSTYYFRVVPGLNLGIVKEVYKLGHEVGYHYETLSKANGDRKKALQMFGKELQLLRSACEIKTVSRHGRPLSRFDDGDLLQESLLDHYELLGDAGFSIGTIPYYTDAGRSWDGRNSIRDRAPEDCVKINVRDSHEMIEMFRDRVLDNAYLNIHPERWVSNRPEWFLSYIVDLSFNIGKRLIYSMRD